MKKFFEKHSLGKTLGILFLVSIVLTWIIPAGSFNGIEFTETGLVRLGLSDFGNLFYYMVAMSIDKILFILALGIFYGILEKIEAYDNLTTNFANKMKGKEILFTVLLSVIIAVLTSFSTSTFAILMFVPFFIKVIKKMELDNLIAFAVTFGSMLVGTLGATFGTDGFTWLSYYISYYLNVDFLKTGMLYRVLILVIGLLLFNFFTVLRVKQITKDNKKESKKEKVIKVKTKKGNSIALIVILCFVALITILGVIDWSGYFNIEIFNKFHEFLTGLTIGKKFTLISYILGSSAAPLGNQVSDIGATFNLYLLISLMLIVSLLLVIIYRFNFDKMLDASKEGLKKFGIAALALICAYSVYMVFYFSPMMAFINSKIMPVEGTPDINIDYKGSGIAFFNIDEDNDNKADKNLINQKDKKGKCTLNCDSDGDGYPDKYLDFDGDGKITDSDNELLETFTGTSVLNLDSDQDGTPDVNVDTDFNLASTVLSALVTSIFHNDLVYTGYTMAGYLTTGFASKIEIVFIVFLTIFGLVAFVAPNSLLLVFGLVFTDVEYKDWLKYIWKFVAGMFICLILIFVLMLLL